MISTKSEDLRPTNSVATCSIRPFRLFTNLSRACVFYNYYPWHFHQKTVNYLTRNSSQHGHDKTLQISISSTKITCRDWNRDESQETTKFSSKNSDENLFLKSHSTDFLFNYFPPHFHRETINNLKINSSHHEQGETFRFFSSIRLGSDKLRSIPLVENSD